MSRSSGVTLREVARHAAVSLATVSMVLNRSEQVSPKTRRRVEEALDRLNYQRRPAGRPRASRARLTNVALVHPYYDGGLAADIRRASVTFRWLDAIHEELVRLGYHLSLFGGQKHIQNDPLFRDMAERGAIHGVVLLGSADDGYQPWLLERKVPLVVVNRRPRQREFSFVEVDNVGGGRLAAEWLLEAAHSRMGVISDRQSRASIQERIEGFEARLAEAGVAPVARQITTKPNDDAEARFCQEVIDRGVTGVFCSDDGLALRCLERWAKAGVDVPGRLSVIGFDAAEMSTAAGLRPSSIGVDDKLLGVTAAEQIIRLLEAQGGFTCLSTTIATKRIPFDTTGPAPQGRDPV